METDRERHENGKAEGVRTETRDNDVKDRQERDEPLSRTSGNKLSFSLSRIFSGQ